VNHPSEVLKPGDEIQVRILDVDPQRRRISLTMKTEEEQQPQAVSPPAQEEEEADRAGGVFAAAWERALEDRRQRGGGH